MSTAVNILFVYPNKEKNPLFKDKIKNRSNYYQFILKIQNLSQASTLLTFPSLAAVTPKQHNIEIIEGSINDINFHKKYDIVGLSCVTAIAFRSYEIADEFRQRGVPVVLGGHHPSALPEEAKQHADSVVIGEAEDTWPQLLKDLEKGNLQSFYYQTKVVEPELIPNARNINPKKSVLKFVQSTRGCLNKCDFCSMPNKKFGKIFRMRPIENVINEIRSIPIKHFGFQDSSMTINTKYTKELFRQMKGGKINKKFSAYGNINILGKDDELLKLASEAGCNSWFVGFESISQDSLNSIGKGSNKVKEYAPSIKKIHDHGMYIFGSFIFGFDLDTKDIFDKTLEFFNSNDIEIANFNILTPYPGTALFNRLDKEGRIFSKDWTKYDFHNVVFEPKNMTPEYLQDNTKRVSEIAYSYSNIFRRTIRSMKLGINTSLIVGYSNIKRRNDYRYFHK